MKTEVRIGNDDDGRRLDRVLRKYLPELPLSALHRLLRKGSILLDGKKATADTRVGAGALLTLPLAATEAAGSASGAVPGGIPPRAERPAGPLPRSARFKILYEDDAFLAVDKESGLLTHGEGSLEELVAEYLRGKLEPSLSFRPGPLHRLDRGTSGIVVFSKSLEGARDFSAALADRRIAKRYLAVLAGRLPRAEAWEDRLDRDRSAGVSRVAGEGLPGAVALTRAEPIAADDGATLALVAIGTGRTHQIRVQAAAHGHPLLGDRKYGGAGLSGGMLLHAYELLPAPRDGERLPPALVAPPPPRFLNFVRERFGKEVSERLERGISPKNGPDAVR
jgi:23S rRNA pseudouridine955/2504/2580 synthase